MCCVAMEATIWLQDAKIGEKTVKDSPGTNKDKL